MRIAERVGESGRRAGRKRLPTSVDYAPTCIWPVSAVRRVAVVTHGLPHAELRAAVEQLTGPERWFRWVQRGPLADPEGDRGQEALDELAPWTEWADAVISDADDRSIRECVAGGLVPVVGLPSARYPVEARRALDVVQPWSVRGLALHLSLGRPSLGLLESAAGMRTRPCREQGPERRSA